jgi:hypothetical protein
MVAVDVEALAQVPELLPEMAVPGVLPTSMTSTP